MIQIKHITKEFKVLNRHEGLKGSLRDLFSRDYKIVRAVDDISMEIAPGEMVGYLGPNGAGKSTTMLFRHDPYRYAGTVAIPAWFRDNDCRKSYLSGADLFSLEVHFRLRRNGCGQRPVLAQIHACAVRLRYGHGEQIQGLRQVSGNHLQLGVPVHLHLHHPHHLHCLLSQPGDPAAGCSAPLS